MYEFIIKILKIGKSLKCDEKHVSDIFSEIRLLDPKLFAKRLHRLGEIRREKDIEMAKNISFVNIASDAGTVLSFHTLYSLITNPFYPQFPVLLEIYDCGNGYNSVQYSEFFDLTVTPLIDEGIEVCGIVTDNLRAQVVGLKSWIINHIDPKVKAIIHIPCLAHSLNLAFIDLFKKISISLK